MDKNALNGGVIGFGKMGMLHAANINVCSLSKLTAACEYDETIRNTVQTIAPHIKMYKDYREMLDKEKLDFAFITTPTHLHVPVALECMERNLNFFLEKPVGISAAEALPLVEGLKNRRLITMMGYMMRYMDTFRYAKGILESKALGKVLSFNTTIYVSQLFKAGKGWRYNKNESGGGCINTQATHALDLITWYFGFPRAVNARTVSHYSHSVEDFGHVTMGWENGLMGWLDSSWSVDNHRMLETSFKIHAENGTLVVDDDFVKIYCRKATKEYPEGWTIKSKPELFKGTALDIGVPHFMRQDEHFIASVQKNQPLECDINHGYKVQKITDSIYQSAESDGQTVTI